MRSFECLDIKKFLSKFDTPIIIIDNKDNNKITNNNKVNKTSII